MGTYSNHELPSYHNETTARRQLIFAHICVQVTAPFGQFVFERSLNNLNDTRQTANNKGSYDVFTALHRQGKAR
jgi:hypothetical protein